METMDMSRRLGAEFFGTFWLTFAGCGSAVLAAGFPSLGIGFLGVSLAFGLTVLTMAYAVGHISGGHFNCAVTVGLWAGGRFKATDVLPYILAQVVGAIAAAAVLYAIASGKPDWVPSGFASDGYVDLSPGLKYSLASCFLIRVVPGAAASCTWSLSVPPRKARRGRFRRHTHRALPDAYSSLPDPGHQCLGQSGAKHRPGAVCWRTLYRATLAVLAGTYPRRGDLPLSVINRTTLICRTRQVERSLTAIFVATSSVMFAATHFVANGLMRLLVQRTDQWLSNPAKRASHCRCKAVANDAVDGSATGTRLTKGRSSSLPCRARPSPFQSISLSRYDILS